MIDTLIGLFLLVALTVLADAVSVWLGLPVPGPVLALGVLLVWFALRGGVDERIGAIARPLVAVLAFLLVPLGVSVVELVDAPTGEIALMVAACLVSLVLSVAAAVAAVLAARRLFGAPDQPSEPGG